MRIDLTPEERALFDAVRFDTPLEYEQVQENRAPVQALMRNLLQRDAIPKIRLCYFTDPELSPGLTKSRQRVFEDNGTVGTEILADPAFLKYLRYFVCGPDLPATTIAEFKRLAQAPFPELEQIRQSARGHARELLRRGRQPEYLAEEFFKLALECGLEVHEAKGIRKSRMSIVGAERRR